MVLIGIFEEIIKADTSAHIGVTTERISFSAIRTGDNICLMYYFLTVKYHHEIALSYHYNLI